MNETPEKVREVIGKMIAAESSGQSISDDRVIALYPSLAGELPDALVSLQAIRSAELQSRAAGAIEQPLQMYSDDELEAPIESDSPEQDEAARTEQIRGLIVGYELIEKIGHGGQAVVYRAKRLSTGGVIAIKILPGGFFATSRARARFDREALALVRVHHPNVVPVLDKGRTSDGSQFIVMGYVEGLPLDRFLAGEKDCRRIAAIFAKISSALQELHRCGIVHRDLKPSNVLVDRYGEPQVLDFGLARIEALPAVTDTGQILGSLPWASPEQAAGRLGDVDERSDIYAMGVMLAYVLDGKPPYPTDGSPMEIARHIVGTQPKVGVGRRPGPLDGVALRCLEKNPVHRFATAQELAEQCALVAAGNRPARSPRRFRFRYSWWLAVYATLLTLGAAGWRIVRPVIGKGDLAMMPVAQRNNPVIALPTASNRFGMHFVKIPAGSFTMGSPLREPGHTLEEQQKRVQILEPFFLATTETTQSAYEQVMKVNPSNLSFKDPEKPVQCVSFNDAVDFCQRLSELDEKRRYRLPTEEEWEYACRASDDAAALSEDRLRQSAWFDQNSSGNLHRVAELSPNRWGIYDMLGGVSEWCSDPSQPNAGDGYGIAKGGAYDTAAVSCRSASRTHVRRAIGSPNLGFRVVLIP